MEYTNIPTENVANQLWEDMVQFPLEILTANKGINLDETFFRVMKVKRGIVCYLSAQCVLMNVILLSFLLMTKEFRKWMFYPVMFQALIDILGPGLANMINELGLVQHMYEYKDEIVFKTGVNKAFPNGFDNLFHGISAFSCVVTYLRVLVNEYSTGSCILVTALYRYILVCHPTIKIPKKVCILLGLGATALTIIGIIGGSADLVFNNVSYTLQFGLVTTSLSSEQSERLKCL